MDGIVTATKATGHASIAQRRSGLRLEILTIASQRLELLSKRFDLRLQPLQSGIFALFLFGLGLLGFGRDRLFVAAIRREHFQGALEQGHVLLAHLLELAE